MNTEKENRDFGWAIAQLKAGNKVSRSGWNGKGMWLVLVTGSNNVHLTPGSVYHKHLNKSENEYDDVFCEILSHIDMYTINSEGRRAMLPGWLASQSDMLAEDWCLV